MTPACFSSALSRTVEPPVLGGQRGPSPLRHRVSVDGVRQGPRYAALAQRWERRLTRMRSTAVPRWVGQDGVRERVWFHWGALVGVFFFVLVDVEELQRTVITYITVGSVE